jgi:transposase-like protein
MKTKPLDPEEINLVMLAKKYSNDGQARKLLESWRWPNGAVCPRCDCKEAYAIVSGKETKNKVRKGLYKCKACRKPFTVTVGTIFEDSHVGLGKWLMAFFLISSCKKGISAHQLHRMLEVTYKTAWFMAHRTRYTIGQNPMQNMLNGEVEADETYVGGKPRHGGRRKAVSGRGTVHKTPVVALIERGGDVRTKVVANVSHKNLRKFVDDNISRSAAMNTDQFLLYGPLFRGWASHDTVNHSKKQYVKTTTDGRDVHVNTCESFFSLIKRSVYGAFHHISKEHLHRYCDEVAFRWNHRTLTDGERMKQALEMIVGKRLTYRQAV